MNGLLVRKVLGVVVFGEIWDGGGRGPEGILGDKGDIVSPTRGIREGIILFQLYVFPIRGNPRGQ